MNAPSYKECMQSQAAELDAPPPYVSRQEQQVLSQLGITQPPQMTEEQKEFLAQLAKDESGAGSSQQLSSSPSANSADLGMMTVINYVIANSMLKQTPVDLPCQFCKQHVTTEVKTTKMRNELTDEEIKMYKKKSKDPIEYMDFVCFCFLLCTYCERKDEKKWFNHWLNTPVAYHECPNCGNLIGLHHGRQAHYCTLRGTEKEQIAELREKLKSKI